MRKALNENPMVQIAVLAIGVIAFGLILMLSMGGGGSDSTAPTDPGATAPSVTGTPETSGSSADVPGAPSPATPSTTTPAPDSTAAPGEPAAPDPSASSAGSTGSADGMLPSKGLPQDLLVAYAKGDAIALLVSNPRSLSDPQMKSAVRSLQKRDDVEVFTVPSDDIAKYSRVTSGVSLSRVPALIVIRPRKLTDNVPTASVSYGFRGKESVEQAIDDALYQGRQRPAYP